MSEWLELAIKAKTLLDEQPPEVQQAIREMSRKKYPQPKLAPEHEELQEETPTEVLQ